MANVVLVHGAWSDGSVWQDVIAHLQRDQHHVLAVQLPLTSLDDDIEWTRAQIAKLDGPITLVGHSYAGMVISGAARDNPSVTALVFVAAYVAEESETIPELTDLGTPMPGRDAIRWTGDGWSTLDANLFRDVLAADLSEDQTNVLTALQKPTHGACLTSPAGPSSWRELPCTYVLSLDDRILDPALQRLFAERSKATLTELDSSHLSPLSHPQDIAAAISRACQGGGFEQALRMHGFAVLGTA